MGRRTKAKAVAAPSSQPSRGGADGGRPLRTRERRASRMSQGREGPSPSLSPSPSPPEMAGGGIRRTAGTLSLPGRPRGRPAGLRLCLPLPQRLRLQLRIPHRTAAPRGTTIRSRSKGAGAGAGEGFGGHGGGSMGMKVLHLYICQYSSQLGLDDGPVLEAHQAGDTAPAALRCPGSRDKVVRTRSPPPDPDPSWRRARFDTAFSASGTGIVIQGDLNYHSKMVMRGGIRHPQTMFLYTRPKHGIRMFFDIVVSPVKCSDTSNNTTQPPT